MQPTPHTYAQSHTLKPNIDHLKQVLAEYLGPITEIREGTRSGPDYVVRTERGLYLLELKHHSIKRLTQQKIREWAFERSLVLEEWGRVHGEPEPVLDIILGVGRFGPSNKHLCEQLGISYLQLSENLEESYLHLGGAPKSSDASHILSNPPFPSGSPTKVTKATLQRSTVAQLLLDSEEGLTLNELKLSSLETSQPMTQPLISRAVKALTDAGLIRYRRGEKVEILDPAGLKRQSQTPQSTVADNQWWTWSQQDQLALFLSGRLLAEAQALMDGISGNSEGRLAGLEEIRAPLVQARITLRNLKSHCLTADHSNLLPMKAQAAAEEALKDFVKTQLAEIEIMP